MATKKQKDPGETPDEVRMRIETEQQLAAAKAQAKLDAARVAAVNERAAQEAAAKVEAEAPLAAQEALTRAQQQQVIDARTAAEAEAAKQRAKELEA